MASEPLKSGSLESYFRDFRSNPEDGAAIWIFETLEGDPAKSFQPPDDYDKNAFVIKYISTVIRDFVKSPYDQDILLSVLGCLQGYDKLSSVKERHALFCKNVGLYNKKTKANMPFDIRWDPKNKKLSKKDEDPYKKNLNSPENSVIGKLSKALRTKMLQNGGPLGYISNQDKVAEICKSRFPAPNYLRCNGYRKCYFGSRIFYVPLNNIEQLAKANDSDILSERPSYTIEQINSGVLGDKIVFNSISDSIIGNEKNFVGIREYRGPNTAGIENHWYNKITVKDGQEYILRLYIHNDNPNGMCATARDVRVAFSIPPVSDGSVRIHGLLSAANATPSEYWDYVVLESKSRFHLEYVYGSALLENGGVGKGGLQLSDEIVTAALQNGTWIVYDSLDNTIPGGSQSISYVTIRIKAVFDTDFRVSQKVRLVGETVWHNYVDAKVGDRLELQTEYKNTDFRNNPHESVAMRAILPKNLKYVSGSTIRFTAATPNGVQIKQDTIVEGGIGIGTYGKDANAYVRFTVEVVDENLVIGTTGLVNWVQASVNGVTLQDFATVRVTK